MTRLFWSSHPETEHVQNILRTDQLFVVLFHNNAHANGLYMRAKNGRRAEASEFDEAVIAFNAAQKKAGYKELSIVFRMAACF